jgi:hypothetical protein
MRIDEGDGNALQQRLRGRRRVGSLLARGRSREHTVTVHVLERDAGNRSLEEENLGLQVDQLGVALDDVGHERALDFGSLRLRENTGIRSPSRRRLN